MLDAVGKRAINYICHFIIRQSVVAVGSATSAFSYSTMKPIATYVFFDLETTGLPREENNKTRITELSMIAVKKDHLLDTRVGAAPRVQHKLTLCFNPMRGIAPTCTKTTGLCNFLLEYEPRFDKDVCEQIKGFLNLLQKPVCLIAQNGDRFDLPILKNHFEKCNCSLPDDLVCVDSLKVFYNILESRKKVLEEMSNQNEVVPCVSNGDTHIGETDLAGTDMLAMQLSNETTPKRQKIDQLPKKVEKVKRQLFQPHERFYNKSGESYRLGDIYERLLNKLPIDAHRAENDCMMTLQCAVALGLEFVELVDEWQVPFSKIKAMALGIPIGE